jgi:hypothetical protein
MVVEEVESTIWIIIHLHFHHLHPITIHPTLQNLIHQTRLNRPHLIHLRLRLRLLPLPLHRLSFTLPIRLLLLLIRRSFKY